MEPPDRAYVSILSWPEGWGHARRVEALVRAGGTDPSDAGMMARGSGPVFHEWFPKFNTPADMEAAAARAGPSSSRPNPVAFDSNSVWVAMPDRAVRGW
jgi:hypothetical protein